MFGLEKLSRPIDIMIVSDCLKLLHGTVQNTTEKTSWLTVTLVKFQRWMKWRAKSLAARP